MYFVSINKNRRMEPAKISLRRGEEEGEQWRG
jgi:hypothetical protein